MTACPAGPLVALMLPVPAIASEHLAALTPLLGMRQAEQAEEQQTLLRRKLQRQKQLQYKLQRHGVQSSDDPLAC